MNLKVGDKVTSDYRGGPDKKTVRRITRIQKDGSGYAASADGGDQCEHCGRIADSIHSVDAAWFKKVEDNHG